MKHDIRKCEDALDRTGKTQSSVAKELGMSRSLVWKFFKGQSVLNTTAKKIIEALGLSVEDVLIVHRRGNGNGKRPDQRRTA